MVSLSHFAVDYWYFCTFRRGSRKLNRHYLRKIPRIDTKFRLCRAPACSSNDSHEKQDIIQIFPNYFVAHMNLVSNDRQCNRSKIIITTFICQLKQQSGNCFLPFHTSEFFLYLFLVRRSSLGLRVWGDFRQELLEKLTNCSFLTTKKTINEHSNEVACI